MERRTASTADDLDRLRIWLEEVAEGWGLGSLTGSIEIRISTRMTRSLGNARPIEKRITLASWLMKRPDSLIREVLCHEAAHIAVYSVFGRGCRPHGEQWRQFMVRAGYEPRVRIDVPNAPQPTRRRRRPRRHHPSRLQRIEALVESVGAGLTTRYRRLGWRDSS